MYRVGPAACVLLAILFSDGTLKYTELEALFPHERVAKRQVGRKIAALFKRYTHVLTFAVGIFLKKHPDLPSLEEKAELGSLTGRSFWVLPPWSLECGKETAYLSATVMSCLWRLW